MTISSVTAPSRPNTVPWVRKAPLVAASVIAHMTTRGGVLSAYQAIQARQPSTTVKKIAIQLGSRMRCGSTTTVIAASSHITLRTSRCGECALALIAAYRTGRAPRGSACGALRRAPD
jgi:hypothetical protein